MKKKSLTKSMRLLMQGLPLAGAVGATLIPVSRLGQQFVMLIVLLWIQIFFVVECFLSSK
jgi:hypothetical protein